MNNQNNMEPEEKSIRRKSTLSIFSTYSILSIASTGSILSIGSAGSILSIGSFGSVYSILSAFSFRGRMSFKEKRRGSTPLIGKRVK